MKGVIQLQKVQSHTSTIRPKEKRLLEDYLTHQNDSDERDSVKGRTDSS